MNDLQKIESTIKFHYSAIKALREVGAEDAERKIATHKQCIIALNDRRYLIKTGQI